MLIPPAMNVKTFIRELQLEIDAYQYFEAISITRPSITDIVAGI